MKYELLTLGARNRVNASSEAVNKGRNVEFTLTAGIIHIANLAENVPLLPTCEQTDQDGQNVSSIQAVEYTHIVDAADGPHASDVAARIASIKAVLVVEVDSNPKGFFGAFGPLQDLFGPIHADGKEP